MEEAIRMLEKLRDGRERMQEEILEFENLCQRLGLPTVTVYRTSAEAEGWYEMHKAYVITHRNDANQFVWYFSAGIFVYIPKEKKWVTMAEWDKDTDLFIVDYEGATNIHPIEREKMER